MAAGLPEAGQVVHAEGALLLDSLLQLFVDVVVESLLDVAQGQANRRDRHLFHAQLVCNVL